MDKFNEFILRFIEPLIIIGLCIMVWLIVIFLIVYSIGLL